MKLIRHRDAADVFWGEVAPCDHMVQLYEGESAFMDSLEAYASGGLQAGDSVILIATPAHLAGLERRLRGSGLDIDQARRDDRYIALDAEETLARLMVDGWPDEGRFHGVVTELLTRATRDGAQVRAFGEMVALLWHKKLYAATVRLEHLWNRFCTDSGFCLLCAYPLSGATRAPSESMKMICEAHSHVITAHGSLPV